MSFLGNIRAFAPRITRLIGSAVAGGNSKDGRWLRVSVTAMAILIIAVAAALSANGSLFATGINNSASVGLSNTVSINAAPTTVNPGASLTLTAKITNSFPNTMITVIITVTGPTCPADGKVNQCDSNCQQEGNNQGNGSPASGSKTVTIITNAAGNGQVSVIYPFTQPFVGTASTCVSGTYHVTATFILVYPIATATTTFTVRAATSIPDFQLGSNPASITCNAGQTITSTITVTPLNGFTGITKLSALVLPSGISVSVSPQNVQGSGTATLTINCSTPGTYTVEVRGTTNYETHSITIPVTVNGTTLPSFSVTGELSASQCAQGGMATDDIAVTAKNGFTGPVTLSTEVAPSGVIATVSPTSLSGSGSATLTINCTTAGIYSVKVKGVSGDLSSTFTVTTTVTSSSTGDFAITAEPASMSNTVDVTGMSTIKVTATGSFAGPVSLSLSTPTGLTCQEITSSLTISTAGGDASTSLKCSSASPGTYTATITGATTGMTHKVDVTFTVPATPSSAATNPSSSFPWLLYLIIALVIVTLVGSGLFLLRRRTR